mgnify:CR=1 FL=1
MSVNEREEAIMQEEKMHRSTYRVLKIFELLSATSEGMSLTGLAQRLEIPKGSLHPILKTMQAMNFIRMNDNGNYTIGQAAYFAGSSYTKNSDLLQEIDYVLKNLSSAVNQTAYFSVLSGGEVYIFWKKEYRRPSRSRQKEDTNIRHMQQVLESLLSGKTEKTLNIISGRLYN